MFSFGLISNLIAAASKAGTTVRLPGSTQFQGVVRKSVALTDWHKKQNPSMKGRDCDKGAAARRRRQIERGILTTSNGLVV